MNLWCSVNCKRKTFRLNSNIPDFACLLVLKQEPGISWAIGKDSTSNVLGMLLVPQNAQTLLKFWPIPDAGIDEIVGVPSFSW